jgi:hypothetical protein
MDMIKWTYASPDMFQNRPASIGPISVSQTAGRHVTRVCGVQYHFLIDFPSLFIPPCWTLCTHPLIIRIAANQHFIWGGRRIRLVAQKGSLCLSQSVLPVRRQVHRIGTSYEINTRPAASPSLPNTKEILQAAEVHKHNTRSHCPRDADISILILSIIATTSVAF